MVRYYNRVKSICKNNDLCTVYSDMISDSYVQNAKQKILFNVPNYSPLGAL